MPTHGLASAYRHGCRCDDCRNAHTAKLVVERAARSQRPASEIPHGKSGYANWGCRCGVCSEAHANYRVGEWDTSRQGLPFTADDLELMARKDLTVSQIAAALRRPYKSVVMKRHSLRRPK